MVNAVRSKKTPEEIVAERLRNLELARATKALYKLQREEAVARGETIETPQTKAEHKSCAKTKTIPTQPMDLNEVLDHFKVEIPFKQLLYHSPDLHEEYGRLLGYPTARGATKVRQGTVVSKWNPENMEVDSERVVSHLSLDTSAGITSPVTLQAVCVAIEDHILNFLIDGGAMISLIPLQVVKDINKVRDIQPTDTLIRFGDGMAEMPVGVVKLLLTLSKDVEIWHHFCVTKTSKTPLILGMDFLKHSGCRPDIKNQLLEFTTEEGLIYQVETHDGDGLLNPGPTPPGAIAEVEEPLVIPVLVIPNSINDHVLDVKLDVEWTLNPAETTVMELHTEGQSKDWTTDKMLQPAAALWTQGVFLMPSLLARDEGRHRKHVALLMNTGNSVITLPKGSLLGKLYGVASVPAEVERIKDFEEVMAYLTGVYANVEIYEDGPSIFEGPVYFPKHTSSNPPQAIYYINTVATCESPRP